MKKRVVITGIGVVSPLGIGKEKFWDSLVNGHSGVSKITSFDTTNFACKIAAEVKDFNPENYFDDKKQIRRTDRFTQFALAATDEAIRDGGINFEKENSSCIGVIIGSGIGGLHTLEEQHRILLEKGPSRVSPFLIPMFITDMAPGEIAIRYGFTGPNYAVSSACASSAHAIGDALRTIRSGDAEVMITGGSETAITPIGVSGFTNMRALSLRNDEPGKASRPFDRNRDGFVIGEGAGIVILETLEHALSRGAKKIYAELAGYGATDDAYHITAPNPNALAASQAMEFALKDAEIPPEEVDYINAHGTSTQLNDKIETLAIKKIFGEYACQIPISVSYT
ncbi:MAG TPA: beta-ketoacyl-[acyl-carrier-protein] synthase II, partial [Elusimicrobia bacterium]|nr:beta-ketoacyl-[acyl-carrier-protein] synthase II [Elusimicrobiota bacterium]